MTGPLLSFLIDVGRSDGAALKTTLETLGAPGEVEWEVLLVGAGAAEAAPPADERVRVLPTTSDDAGLRLNQALSEARGEYSLVISAGLRFDPGTLTDLAAVLRARRDVDLFYTHEAWGDRGAWTVDGKPAWSPERLRGLCYLGPCAGVRSSLAREVGGIRAGLSGEHRYDLLLRIGERAAAVIAVPAAVRADGPAGGRGPVEAGAAESDSGPPQAAVPVPDVTQWDARVRVVREHLERHIPGATARRGTLPGTVRVVRTLAPEATVTAVVVASGDRGLAWGDQRYYLAGAVSSLLEHAGSATLEVLVGLSDGADPRSTAALAGLASHYDVPIRIESVPAGFQPSQTVNHLVTRSDGEFVLALQERVEVMSPDFVTELVGPLADPDLGLSGPRVLTSDGVHVGAGVAIWADRFQPMHQGRLDTDPGRGGELAVTHEVSALLPHVWATRRTHYRRVGGLSEKFRSVSHVDLAYKLQREGLRRLWVAPTRLVTFPPPTVADATALQTARELDRRALSLRWQSDDLDPYAPYMGRRRLERITKREAEILA